MKLAGQEARAVPFVPGDDLPVALTDPEAKP